MQLTELIRKDLIKINLDASNKWQAIEELIDLLISAHELSLLHRKEIIDAVYARERSLSTGLEYGLAVPHAAVGCIDDVLAALGTSDGIPFESVDGKPARLVVLLLIPQGAFQRHVRTLAGIAKLGSIPELRQRIFEAVTPEEVMEVLRKSDQTDIKDHLSGR